MSPDVKPAELIELIGRALELELDVQVRDRLLHLLQVPQQLFRIDVDADAAGAHHVRLSLQLSDRGRRLAAALGAGNVDPLVIEDALGHDGSPNDRFAAPLGEGESPAGDTRPAADCAEGGVAGFGDNGPELVTIPRSRLTDLGHRIAAEKSRARVLRERESMAFGTVFATAGARGTWSYDLPDDPLLAPLALRMLQGCADQIAEVCRLVGGQAERPSVGGAAGAVDKDDFDARVEALQKFFNRGKVGVVDGDGQSLADVGQKAKGVAAALGGDDGEGFRKDLYGEDLGAGAPDNVEQGGGLSVQLGEVGHGASPDGGLQGPSGEGESSAGDTRPAADCAAAGPTWIGKDGPELITVPRPGHAAVNHHGLCTYRTESVSLDVWQRPGAPFLELRIGDRRGEIVLTPEATAHLIALLSKAAPASAEAS